MTLVSAQRVVMGSFGTVYLQDELFSVRPVNVYEGLQGHGFILDVTYTLHLYGMVIPGGRVCLLGISNIRTSVNINRFILRLLKTTCLVDTILHIVYVVLDVVMLRCILSAETRGCARPFFSNYLRGI